MSDCDSRSLSSSPLGLAKPGADVRSTERACRSEFERPSEAAKRIVREPEDAVKAPTMSIDISCLGELLTTRINI